MNDLTNDNLWGYRFVGGDVGILGTSTLKHSYITRPYPMGGRFPRVGSKSSKTIVIKKKSNYDTEGMLYKEL